MVLIRILENYLKIYNINYIYLIKQVISNYNNAKHNNTNK